MVSHITSKTIVCSQQYKHTPPVELEYLFFTLGITLSFEFYTWIGFTAVLKKIYFWTNLAYIKLHYCYGVSNITTIVWFNITQIQK